MASESAAQVPFSPTSSTTADLRGVASPASGAAASMPMPATAYAPPQPTRPPPYAQPHVSQDMVTVAVSDTAPSSMFAPHGAVGDDKGPVLGGTPHAFAPPEVPTQPAKLPPLCRVPIFCDLAHQQTRSVVITCAVVLIMGLDMLVNAVLPALFGGASTWTCAQMYYNLMPTSRDTLASMAGTTIFSWLLFTPFVTLSLLAASPYAHPVYVPMALAAAVSYFGLFTASDTQYCFRTPPQTAVQQFAVHAMDGQSTTQVITLHVALWLANIVIIADLVRLTLQYIHKRRQGALADMCVLSPGMASSRQPLAATPSAFQDISIFCSKVPLRHSLSCIVSVAAVVTITIYMHTQLDSILRGLAANKLMQTALSTIIGVVWVSFVIVLGLMAYSCVAIARQHDELLRVYYVAAAPQPSPGTTTSPLQTELMPAALAQPGNAGTVPPSSQPPEVRRCWHPAFIGDSNTPNLDAFDYSDAIMYTSVHVLLNLVVFLCILVVVAVVFFVLIAAAFYSPGSIVIYIFGTLQPLVSKWLRYTAPLMPTSGVCGWVRYLSCTTDRRISRPHWLLFADAFFMFSFTFIWAFSFAINRLLMSIVWAILRVALLHEPVLPRPLAMWDASFTSHGAMMKMRFLAVLDPLADSQNV